MKADQQRQYKFPKPGLLHAEALARMIQWVGGVLGYDTTYYNAKQDDTIMTAASSLISATLERPALPAQINPARPALPAT
jgi:hypothetical protein